MNCGREKNPTYHIFIHLDANVFILNTMDNLGKFDAKSDNGIFLRYSETSKAFKRALVVEEAIHIRFDKNKHDKDLSELDASFVDLRLDDSSIATSSSR